MTVDLSCKYSDFDSSLESYFLGFQFSVSPKFLLLLPDASFLEESRKMKQKKTIDFSPLKLTEEQLDTPIADIMPSSSDIVLAKTSDGIYEVITREAAQERSLSDFASYLTNQTDMVKAGAKLKYLNEDLALFYQNFLSDHLQKGTKIEVYGEDVDKDVDYICIRNFPLPNFYTVEGEYKDEYKPTKEDIIVVIAEYPEFSPHGIHIRSDSPNRERIEEALRGHLYDAAIGHPEDTEDLEEQGWNWLCFHYEGKRWNFNLKDIKRGDCLAKYFINLYVALSGVYPDA